MRIVKAEDITRNIKEMCIEANLALSADVKEAICEAGKKETSELGKQIIKTLEENMSIAKTEQIPICQDTGMTVVFAKIGQDVHIDGMYVEDAINQGIREGYEQGYLRKSVVKDPIERVNTKDNTPGVIHYEIVKGDKIELTVAPKGFGSENMSRVYMLKPADGIEGVKDAVIDAKKRSGIEILSPVRPMERPVEEIVEEVPVSSESQDNDNKSQGGFLLWADLDNCEALK